MTRTQQVLAHLTSGRTLTQGEAVLLGYGTRLSSTIEKLRKRGHNIVTTMKTDINGYPYGEYRLLVRDRWGKRKAA